MAVAAAPVVACQAGGAMGGYRRGARLLHGLAGEEELICGGELGAGAAAQQRQLQRGAGLRGGERAAQALQLA